MATTSDLQSRAGVGRRVMEERAPVFSAAQAEGSAQRAFEIRASAHPLASELDQNPPPTCSSGFSSSAHR